MPFNIWGERFGVSDWGLGVGFRVLDFRFGVPGLRFGVLRSRLAFGVRGWGLRVGVGGLEFGIHSTLSDEARTRTFRCFGFQVRI